LHIAGGKIEFDSTKNAGERIVNVFIKNSNGNYIQVKDEQTYPIVTNSFLAKGAEGYQMFAKLYAAGKVTDLGVLEWNNFRDFLVGLKKIPTETEGRIVDVGGQK
jgi:5'-nucleotidase/2',3'-cyclic-nucleotide 2'-phosphodiesterase/3'-nucleotidase/5'-nucleotidase